MSIVKICCCQSRIAEQERNACLKWKVVIAMNEDGRGRDAIGIGTGTRPARVKSGTNQGCCRDSVEKVPCPLRIQRYNDLYSFICSTLAGYHTCFLKMGWFSSSPSSPSPAAPEPSKDGGYIAPDRTARAQCWEGRDSFFRCLDQHGIIDSVKEDDKAKKLCAKELREFEGACASSWVSGQYEPAQ